MAAELLRIADVAAETAAGGSCTGGRRGRLAPLERRGEARGAPLADATLESSFNASRAVSVGSVCGAPPGAPPATATPVRTASRAALTEEGRLDEGLGAAAAGGSMEEAAEEEAAGGALDREAAPCFPLVL